MLPPRFRSRAPTVLVGCLLTLATHARGDAPFDWTTLSKLDGPGTSPLRTERVRRFLQTASVRSLAQDSRGFIWVGTESGVARFDGHAFVWIANEPRLEAQVPALTPSADGGMWLGLQQPAAVLHYRDGVVHEPFTIRGERDETLHDLTLDAKGVLWILTDRGLRSWDGQRLQTVPRPKELWLSSLAASADGTLYVATDQGLARVRDGQLEPLTKTGAARGLVLTTDGHIWFASDDGPTRLDPSSGAITHITDPLARDLSPFLVDREGVLWLGNGGSFARFADGRFIPGNGEALLDASITSVIQDREGHVWLGSLTVGLVQIKRWQPFVLLGPGDGLPSVVAFTVAPRKRGGVWVSTTGGLAYFERGRFHAVSQPGPPWPAELRSLLDEDDGGLWVAGFSTGLYRLQDGKFTAMSGTLGLPAGGVRSLMRARDGALWIGMDNTDLAVVRGGRTVVHRGRDLGVRGAIWGMCEDRRGNTWLITGSSGLLRFDGETFTHLGRGDGVPTERWNAITCRDDAVWFATPADGVVRFDGQRWSQVDHRHGLLMDDVGQLVFDRRGSTWLSSRHGFQRVDTAALERVARGQQSTLKAQRFDVADGMASNTSVWSWAPAGTLSDDGAVWFPTLRGVVVVPAGPEVHKPSPPKPFIQRLTHDGRELITAPVDVAPLPMARGAGNLEIAYTAPTFDAPHRLLFRYRLHGFDRDWVAAGSRRVAFYTNVPAGQYRFEIEVRSEGNDRRQRRSVSLELVPPFYRTRAFSAAAIVCGLLLIGGLFRLWLWQQRARFGAVVDERNRIARDMHDTLEQSLVAAKLQLDAAETGLAQPDHARKRIARARELVDRSLREAKGSIWALRSGLSDVADLRAALSASIGEALLGTKVAFQLHVTGPSYRLEPEAERQVVRVAQEAVTNALKHGRPSRLDLTLTFASEGLRLRCQDDGQGFDTEAAGADGKPLGTSYGLRGMRERAESLGGTLVITSSPEAGTAVEAFVPARWRRAGPVAS